jgi:hypothetical protein
MLKYSEVFYGRVFRMGGMMYSMPEESFECISKIYHVAGWPLIYIERIPYACATVGPGIPPRKNAIRLM